MNKTEADKKTLSEAAAELTAFTEATEFTTITEAIETFTQLETVMSLAEPILRISKTLQYIAAEYSFSSPEIDKLPEITERWEKFNRYLADQADEIAAMREFDKEFFPLVPFIEEVLKERGENISAGDLLNQVEPDGEPTTDLAKEVLAEARKKLSQNKIAVVPTDKLNLPLDKINANIWNLIVAADPKGQINLAISTKKKGAKKDAFVYYGINFDALEDLKITKQLTSFDKRCYIAAAALFNAGNETFSVTQIYKMMGNSGRPAPNQLDKINDSLTKMGAARVYIDNTNETQALKYPAFVYDAPLLPFERMSAYINGQLVDRAIHLFREPPLITFARERHQITTVSLRLLESPVSKTEANLRIDDYLMERIGHMQKGTQKAPRKILFSTVCKQCRIETKKQQQRALEIIRRYLDHYKKCEWIKNYTEEQDGITIIL